jgi:hypothetical protein
MSSIYHNTWEPDLIEDKYSISSTGRTYLRGSSLSEREIVEIRKKFKTYKIMHETFNDREIIELIKSETGVWEKTIKKALGTEWIQRTHNLGVRHRHNTMINQYIKNIVAEDPTIYLYEIRDKMLLDLEVSLSCSQICRILNQQLNITRKKCVKIAYYRTLDYVQEARAQWRRTIRHYNPLLGIYIDESHFDDKNLVRMFGYSEKGKDAITTNHKPSSQTWSLICAMSSEGILHEKLVRTEKRGVNTEIFTQFLMELIPKIPPVSTMLPGHG